MEDKRGSYVLSTPDRDIVMSTITRKASKAELQDLRNKGEIPRDGESQEDFEERMFGGLRYLRP
jgi:hypothetical protein